MKKRVLLSAFILIITIFYIGCKTPEPVQEEAMISFVGDIIMHNPIKRTAFKRNKIDPATKKSLNNRGFDYFFDKIKPVLKESDIVQGNMEFPIHPPYKSGNMIFNCFPEILPSLKKSGFTMLNFANNHTLDQKVTGVKHSINELKKNSFDYIGVDSNETKTRAGIVKKIKGAKIGFIGYTGVTNYRIPKKQKGYYINWFYDKKKVLKDIINMKKRCDYLILTVHTGAEYQRRPKKSDVKLMKEYINMGVDLIIGHHPHVLQPVEKVIASDGRECVIFYSLGNFISNQSYGAIKVHGTQDSIIATVILKIYKTDDEKKVKIKSSFEITPLWNFNRYLKKQGKTVYVLSIPREYEKLKQQIANPKKNKIYLKKEMKFLLNKEKNIKKWVMGGKTITSIKFKGINSI